MQGYFETSMWDVAVRFYTRVGWDAWTPSIFWYNSCLWGGVATRDCSFFQLKSLQWLLDSLHSVDLSVKRACLMELCVPDRCCLRPSRHYHGIHGSLPSERTDGKLILQFEVIVFLGVDGVRARVPLDKCACTCTADRTAISVEQSSHSRRELYYSMFHSTSCNNSL